MQSRQACVAAREEASRLASLAVSAEIVSWFSMATCGRKQWPTKDQNARWLSSAGLPFSQLAGTASSRSLKTKTTDTEDRVPTSTRQRLLTGRRDAHHFGDGLAPLSLPHRPD